MDRIYRNKVAITLFILPAFVLFTLVLLIPILQAFYYSLNEWNALSAPKFVGFDNYVELLTKDKIFMIALKNSIFFMIFSSVTQQFFGLLLAGVLTNIKRGKNFFKNVYYLPAVLSSAALGLLWSFLLNPKIGINQLLDSIGIDGPLWLMETGGFIVLPMWVIASVALWQYVGTTMMLYMAQMSSISKSLYEASYIDGAGKFRSFILVTLPLVRPMVVTSLSLNAIGSLKFFDLVYNMTQGGPSHRTEVLATHLYYEGFEYFKYGYASAIGIFLLALCLIMTLIISRVFRSDEYGM